MKNRHGTRLFALIVAGLFIPACGSGGDGSSGETGVPEPAQAQSSLPPAPKDLDAKAGDSTVVLSWNPVIGAGGYNLKRASNHGGPYALVAVYFASTLFDDDSVRNGVRYFYVVSAVNNVGEGPDSNEASATPKESRGE